MKLKKLTLPIQVIFTNFAAMPSETKKILLMGDYSNCHRALATGLRRLGHDVTVASNGSRWMDTERDIDLSRPFKGKIGGAALWLKLCGPLRHRLEGYDIVALHNPIMIEQRPNRCSTLFNRLKARNGAVFLTAMGADINYIDACLDPEGPLPFNEWMIYGRPSPMQIEQPDLYSKWNNLPLRDHTRHVYDNIDGAASILFEYDLVLRKHLPADKRAYIGLPIDTRALQPVELPDRIDRVKFFLGRHAGRLAEKGTDLLEQAARTVVERNPRHADLVIVENKPYAEYIQLLKSAHVVLDQIYSYTPATNALLAMAYGLNTVSGGEPEFYDFIGEKSNRPVINAPVDYDALVDTLQRVVDNRNSIAARGRASREFVVKHNDTDKVAARAIEFWTSRINAGKQC